MSRINIATNIEEHSWLEILPDVKSVISKACRAALKESGIAASLKEIEISILLTNDANIRSLNHAYRNKNKATNVLSFPQEEMVAGDYSGLHDSMVLGDIIFALETIQKEAKEQNKTFTNHLSHMAVHGTLHLIGYDHEENDEAEIMEGLEVEVLNGLGIANPY